MGRHGWGDDTDGADAPDADDDALAPWDRPGGGAVPSTRGRRTAVRWFLRAVGVLLVLAAGIVAWRWVGASDPAQGVAVGPASPPGGGATEAATGASPRSPVARGDVATDGPTPDVTAGADSTDPQGRVGNAGTTGPVTGGTQATGPTVHVVGAVSRPGLYSLREGARVQDAVTAAGGPTREASLASINLAAPVPDGAQLRVPTRAEAASASAQPGGAANGSDSGAGSGTGAGADGGHSGYGLVGPSSAAQPGGAQGTGTDGGQRLRINAASAAELEALPGIGPALAQRLVQFRDEHGPFRSGADLDAVPGIGPALLAKLEAAVSYD